MPYSISTLLIRNLRDVFGENDPARRRAAIDEIYTEDCVFYDPAKGVYRGRDEIDRIAGAIKATHPEFRYQPITEPRNRAMADWSAGYQAARMRRQLTPGPISSLRRTAGSPPFISFSTSYRELDSAVRRVPTEKSIRCHIGMKKLARDGISASARSQWIGVNQLWRRSATQTEQSNEIVQSRMARSRAAKRRCARSDGAVPRPAGSLESAPAAVAELACTLERPC